MLLGLIFPSVGLKPLLHCTSVPLISLPLVHHHTSSVNPNQIMSPILLCFPVWIFLHMFVEELFCWSSDQFSESCSICNCRVGMSIGKSGLRILLFHHCDWASVVSKQIITKMFEKKPLLKLYVYTNTDKIKS